jgi:hypothetical protein
MFKGEPDYDAKAKFVADHLLKPDTTLDHIRPIQVEELTRIGVKVQSIEDDPVLQDAELSLHHT